MKRVLFSLCLAALSAPAWTQDEEADDSAATSPRMTREEFCEMAPEGTQGCPRENAASLQTGPSESDIEDLLDLLDSEEEACEGEDCGTDAEAEADPDDATDADPDDSTVTADGQADEDMADGASDTGTANPDADGSAEDTATADEVSEAAADAAEAGESGEDTATADEASEDAANAGEANPSTDDADPDGSAEEDGSETDESEAELAQAGDPHIVTPSAPFLNSTDYALARDRDETDVLRLEWQVETFTPDGLRAGEPSTRIVYLSPGFVREENGNAVSVYDFAYNRHLTLDLSAGTMVNNAFEAEVRRRTDTYLGLSQAGRLEQIPLGPNRSFDRFWLEAAMGIRREPVELQTAFANGELTVTRGMGASLLSASFDIEDEETAEDISDDDASRTEAAVADEADDTAMDDILAMATPIDLSSGESVVFDPSQAAAPIALDLGTTTLRYPDAAPEDQAQAELFRRWMRHALPLHPDVLAALRGAPAIPQQFSYFIVSPDSPEGRREVWTLQAREAAEDGFMLEPDLTAHSNPPALLSEIVLPAAAIAAQQDTAPGEDAFIEAINAYREAGDLARAYLVTFQESSRNGPCPPPGQAATREVCGEVSSLVAAGLGDPDFESVFAAVNQIGGDDTETLLQTLTPYLEDDTLAGAAARTIIANELLAWAVRDPEGPPEDLNPNALLAEAIAIDPFAGANYRYLGNSLLTLRNPVGAWAVFDAGRAVAGAGEHPMLQAVGVQEERLHGLAPDFFLPR